MHGSPDERPGVRVRKSYHPPAARPAAVPATDAERSAARRVLRDLALDADETRLMRVTVTPDQVMLRLPVGDREVFLACGPGEPEPVLAWRFADQLQEYVLESGGPPRPPCPAHGHPLSPDIDPTGAWWTCPEGREHAAVRVGELSADSAGNA